MTNSKASFNKKIFFETFLVKFPIIFPLIYFFILYQYPKLEDFLIFFTLLILAEPHFGATWPFLLYKKNFKEIKNNKITYILLPLLIVFSSFVLFLYSKTLFFFIFLVANVFHVTRQSTGICKLYIKDPDEKNLQVIIINLFSILFFFIGLIRFYTPYDFISFSYVSILILIISFWWIKKYKLTENFFILLTGILIFFPMCFVEKPIHAIVMGVTMHYSQYLYLTHKVYKNRILNNGHKNKNYYFLVILTYGLLMSLLSLSGKTLNFKDLILIPIIGQFLHFYIDSLLWKFSTKHHREVTLKYLIN